MAEGRRYTPGPAPHDALLAHLVSRHRSDVAGCVQPSERSARRIAQPIPSCIGKRCNAAMRFDGQRGPTDDRWRDTRLPGGVGKAAIGMAATGMVRAPFQSSVMPDDLAMSRHVAASPPILSENFPPPSPTPPPH